MRRLLIFAVVLLVVALPVALLSQSNPKLRDPGTGELVSQKVYVAKYNAADGYYYLEQWYAPGNVKGDSMLVDAAPDTTVFAAPRLIKWFVNKGPEPVRVKYGAPFDTLYTFLQKDLVLPGPPAWIDTMWTQAGDTSYLYYGYVE